MSWNFKVRGSSKKEVLNAFSNEMRKTNSPEFSDRVLGNASTIADGFPQLVVATHTIDGPKGEDGNKTKVEVPAANKEWIIESFGHLNEDGSGSVMLHVRHD